MQLEILLKLNSLIIFVEKKQSSQKLAIYKKSYGYSCKNLEKHTIWSLFLGWKWIPPYVTKEQCHIKMYFGTIWTVWVPKKVLVILFPYIFHTKTKSNIVYKYLKTKIFSRETGILPQMHWISVFRTSATAIGGFGVSLNYPILNFKKMVCPKNV